MELRHLRYFVAVVDAGGVSRAAKRLNISQPALSRQIRDLEAELGVTLFERRAGRLVLTGGGEDLSARGRELLRGADTLRERAHALRRGDSGIIRVGVAPLTLESLLPPFLSRYQRRHPKIEVHLVEDSPSRLWARLERAELNVAISFPGHEGLGSRLLFPVFALGLMAASHRLARRATLEVADLSGEPLLLPSPHYLTRQWFDAACQRDHLRPTVALESSAPHALIALARVGYGIAIVPSHTLFDRRGLGITRVLRHGVALGTWAAITWDPHAYQPPFVSEFVEELVAHARRTYPAKEFFAKSARRSMQTGFGARPRSAVSRPPAKPT